MSSPEGTEAPEANSENQMPGKTRSYDPKEAAHILSRFGQKQEAARAARDLSAGITADSHGNSQGQPMTPERAKRLLVVAREIVTYLEAEAER